MTLAAFGFAALTGADTRHTRARARLTAAFPLALGRAGTLPELQIAQAVALHEGGYGEATYWDSSPLRGTPDYGKGERGGGGTGEGTAQAIPRTGTNNWGASQAGKVPCGANSVEITDASPKFRTAENPRGGYQVCLSTFATPEEGAAAFLRVLYRQRPTVLAAASQGSALAVARAMYATKYYEGFSSDGEKEAKSYAGIILKHATSNASAIGEPLVISDSGTGGSVASSGGMGGIAILAGVVGIGAILVMKGRT